MINDAAFEEQCRLKYVDDLTIYQSCPINTIEEGWKLQKVTDDLSVWASENKMTFNEDKCQVMHFITAKRPIVFPDIIMNGKSLPVVTKTKLLGVTLSSDLSWQEHVNGIVKRASKALYMLCVMKKYQAPQEQLVKIYTTYIRPLLEYCAPVFHAGLTCLQAKQLENVQKRALKLIGGYEKSYQDLLETLQLQSLANRREQLCLRLAKQILKSTDHRDILPLERGIISGRATRNVCALQPFCCGARLRKSTVPHMTALLNLDMQQNRD